MAIQTTGGHVGGFLQTNRTDNWWVGPLVTFLALAAWLIFYFLRAMEGQYYAVGPYLSPFYAPLIYADPSQVTNGGAHISHAFLGTWPSWWPAFVPASPALIIGMFPGTFRLTCYYYRKAYYRAFGHTPTGCAVGPAPSVVGGYQGETGLWIFQNLHRYTLYFAIILLPFLYYEAASSFFYKGSFGIGLGGLLITANAVLLTGYTLGCHAWRHLIGGKLNCFSCDGVSRNRHQAWSFTTWLNERHMLFAWVSLWWILFTDVYITLCSRGIISDPNTWGTF